MTVRAHLALIAIVLAFDVFVACAGSSPATVYVTNENTTEGDAAMSREYSLGPEGGGTRKSSNGYSASGQLITTQGISLIGGQGISCQKPYDEESDVYTVQFGIVFPINSSGVIRSAIRPQAIVKFSVAEGEVQRIIDVGPGSSISGPAQAVKVSLYDAAVVGSGVNAGIPYPASIQIARGVRGNGSQPPTLYGGQFTIADMGATATIAVPLNAGVTSALVNYVSGDATANIINVLESASGVGVKTYAALPAGAQFVPIAPNTTALVLTNNSTTNNAVVTVTWGIDG